MVSIMVSGGFTTKGTEDCVKRFSLTAELGRNVGISLVSLRTSSPIGDSDEFAKMNIV